MVGKFYAVSELARRLLPLLLGIAFLTSAADVVSSEEDSAALTSPGSLNFIGKNLLGKAKGTFSDWRVVESSFDLKAISEAFVVVEINLASVDTGNGDRDDHLRNPDFFEVETYPTATVRVHSAVAIEGETTGEENEGRRFAVQFDIDLHGVQKTVEGEIVLASTLPVVFEGSLVIDRLAFGIGSKKNWYSPMAPAEEVPVSFRIAL